MVRTGPLSHLRVLELVDGLPAASCGRLFARWGADVIVVEREGGSPLRASAPFAGGADGGAMSLTWEHIAANKRCGRLEGAPGAEAGSLRRLSEEADLVITDWDERRLELVGVTKAELCAQSPALIWLAFDAPHPCTDLTIQAASGILSVSGHPGRAPLKVPANILPYAVGVAGFVGAMAAIQARRRSGRGESITVDALEVVASLVLVLRAQYFGAPFPRRSGVSTLLLRCADGYVLCAPRWAPGWENLMTALGVAPDSVPEQLRAAAGRTNDAELRAFLEPSAAMWPAEALFEALGSLGMAAGLLQSPAELVSNKQLLARSFFTTEEHEQLGSIARPGPAAQMSECPLPPTVPARPWNAPIASLSWLAPAEPRPDAPVPASAGREPPLAGLRVLDLTGAWIGPYAAMLLGDLGADVIKVESPTRPDVWRGYRPGTTANYEAPLCALPGSHPWNTSHYYNSVNRNKRSLTLDLGRPEGRETFLRLVRDADVLMENFTPRVMGNFNLGYEVLRAVNPQLVEASFSGYGSTGPWHDFRANGATTETGGGWVSLFGYSDEPPMLMGEMEADPLCGLQMAAHTLVALEHRARCGRGQRVDGSMLAAAAEYIAEEILFAQVTGFEAHPRANRDRIMAPQGVYPCAGVDGWIALSVRDDRDWDVLLALPSAPAALRDPRFCSAAARRAHADEIDVVLAAWTAPQAAPALARWLTAAGLPAAAVVRTDEVISSGALAGWFRPLFHADTGPALHNGHLWRFAESPLVWQRPPPLLGEHNAEVLAESGFAPAEIEQLARNGVTAAATGIPGPAAANT